MKKKSLKLALFFILTATQVFVLSFFLTYKNLSSILGSWSGTTSLTIYLKTDINENEKIEINQRLLKNNQISDFKNISRTQSASEFQKSIGGFAAGLLSEEELIDLVPESIDVRLKNATGIDQKINLFQALSDEFKKVSGVEEVVYGSSWLKRFSKINSLIDSLGISVFSILFLSMIFLVFLMIRVSIEEARSEIEIYSLIGATRWTIYRLFLNEIFILIAITICCALVFEYGLFAYLKNIYLKKAALSFVSEQMIYLNSQEILALCLSMMTLVVVSSFFALSGSMNKISSLSYENN